MKVGLQGKVALITGGSKGIGLETAVHIANEGADVAIVARGEEALQQAANRIQQETGKTALPITADVTDAQACERAVRTVTDHFGALHILVNNAGTSSAHTFENVDDELWHGDLELKLFAAVRFSRLAVSHMRQVGGGAIVNVTASAAKTPPASSLPTSVSRAAGMALTKAMSRDLARDNIRVNTVGIGLIRSDQIEKAWQKTAPELTWEEYARDERHDIPLGRIGDTHEAAKVITFFVSDAASYVTGTSVNIDGGKAAAL